VGIPLLTGHLTRLIGEHRRAAGDNSEPAIGVSGVSSGLAPADIVGPPSKSPPWSASPTSPCGPDTATTPTPPPATAP
jgi:hypothetical protein